MDDNTPDYPSLREQLDAIGERHRANQAEAEAISKDAVPIVGAAIKAGLTPTEVQLRTGYSRQGVVNLRKRAGLPRTESWSRQRVQGPTS
jgi:hypothetical protein